ncbi:Putative transporter [Elusimicrobium minutum Pei191]|uniref:Putative transporter n=1 Tax=Elusimicrobium minutum (strain Pei191) TaxID=445932 RepID=B2KC38_ELUMP|nr:solute:sodium symporter family transporter [Elusimicrobium minutum]ACC98165.1 Putative transporter [Elusimicrobium minutum Pei191]
MAITFVAFFAFTMAVLGLAYYKTKNANTGTEEGYFLAGRGLTGWVIAASLLLTNLSCEQMVGLNGQGYGFNMSVMAWEVTAAAALIIVALYFLPRYLKQGYATVPDFAADRYDAATKHMINGLFLLGYVFILFPIILYAGAVGMGGIFNLKEVFGFQSDFAMIAVVVVAIGILGCIYNYFGGLRIIAWADTFNGIGLLVGGLMIPILGLMFIGDGNLITGLNILITENPEKFNSIGKATDPVPFATIFTGMFLVNLFYWGTNQVIIQRALAAKNLKEGQKGVLICAVFKLMGPLFLVLPGIIAYHIFKDNPLNTMDMAYSSLVRTVLHNPLLVGLFAAVLFGAILSAFSGAINSTSTLFTLNVYKPFFAKKDATDADIVKKGKMAAIILVLFSMCVAPLISFAPKGLFQYLQTANGLYNVPIFTLILVGMFNKKAPAWAAKTVLIGFIIVYSFTQLLPMIKGGVYASALPGFLHWFVHLHFLHILAILFFICAAFMLITGHFWPTDVKFDIHNDKKVIDMKPWSLVYVISFIIFAAVVGIYILLSPIGIAK